MNIRNRLCTSVRNDGYPKFTTIMDVHNCFMDIQNWIMGECRLKMQWSQCIAQLMLPIIQLWISITQISTAIYQLMDIHNAIHYVSTTV